MPWLNAKHTHTRSLRKHSSLFLHAQILAVSICVCVISPQIRAQSWEACIAAASHRPLLTLQQHWGLMTHFLTSSSQTDFFFFWLMLPAHPHESRQTKRMPCELQACANGCSRGKLCPKRNVMWPGEHAQAARQPSFTAVVWWKGAWKNYQGFYYASDFIYCDFYFLHERSVVWMQIEGTMPRVITQH